MSKPLRFEESWVDFEEYKEIVSKHWKEERCANIQTFQMKVLGCLGKLKRRNKERLNGSLKAAISRKEKEIEILASTPVDMEDLRIRKAENELEDLLEEEEKYWHARSRECWLKWGDKNTKWFHWKASHRRQKK